MVGVLVALLVLAGAGWAAVALFGDDEPDPVALPSPSEPAPEPEPEPVPSAPPAPSPSAPDGLDELFGEGGLDDLLGEGGLDDLLGEGGLEDLFGEGGLDDLFGGQFDPELLACLAPSAGGQPSLGGTPLPDDPEEAIRTIADQVAELRALAFTDEVDLELLTADELADRVGEVVDEEYDADSAAADQAILAALGQVDPDLDLQATYQDLLTEQVAGFYDPETGELVALSSADELAPSDRVIVAHELDHALTDQALGLPELDDDQDLDAVLAQQGLVEGDATVLMQQWASANLGLTDQLGMAVPQADTQALDQAPYVLQQQLLYPYTAGMSFVCSQYNEGGWAAVDDMYANLPTTTAQVLWPERYEAGEAAVDVPEVDLPGGDELRATTWGAADLLWLLEAPGDDPTAALPGAMELAADWAGGSLTAWETDAGTTVSLSVAQQPGGALCATMQRWYEAAFPASTATRPDRGQPDERRAWDGGGQAGSVACTGDLVTTTVGPDLTTVRSVETD